MKFFIPLILAALSACASPKPQATVARPPASVQPVVEPLHEGIKPLTVEQDEQISG